MFESSALLMIGLAVAVVVLLAIGKRPRRKAPKPQNAPEAEKPKYRKTAQEVGQDFEILTGRAYYNRGYQIEHVGLNRDRRDNGIDIVAKKDGETVLIQCKYWKNKKVDHTVVRSFFGDCFVYICKEGLELDKVRCVMAIPARSSLDYSAEVRFKQNFPRMRYEVVEG